MVKQASEVVGRLESLPDGEQVLLASYLQAHFDEVMAEARWDESLRSASGFLDELVAGVDSAISRGQVKELDPDEL